MYVCMYVRTYVMVASEFYRVYKATKPQVDLAKNSDAIYSST